MTIMMRIIKSINQSINLSTHQSIINIFLKIIIFYLLGCIERSLVGKNHLNIPDSSFTASSRLYQDSNPSDKHYMPYNARLNGQWGWSPRDNDNSTDYLQIDLGAVRVITAVATQGNGGSKIPGKTIFEEWVTHYKLEFKKDDSSEWIEYQRAISINNLRLIYI